MAATYLAAATITGGEVTVADARREHMETFLRKLATIGGERRRGEDGLTAQGPRAARCAATWPRCPIRAWRRTTSRSLVAMLSIADGTSVVTENLFEGRFRYVEELVRMGASVTTEGHHVVIRGIERLTGAPVRATDVRARRRARARGARRRRRDRGANAEHVDRGYEDLAGTLRSLGADVERV